MGPTRGAVFAASLPIAFLAAPADAQQRPLTSLKQIELQAARPAPTDSHRFAELDASPFSSGLEAARSWPVADNLALGAGILPVIGTRVVEKDFRRADPMQSIGARSQRVAAVRVRLSF
jgi:hypothetical protein